MALDSIGVANEAECTLALDGEAATLRVTSLRCEEALCELFRFRVRFACEDAELDLEAAVGADAALTLSANGAARELSGIVRRVRRCGQAGPWSLYAAEIVPLHWLLAKRTASRVFQECNCPDMSVPGVIRKVLSDAGIPEARTRFALQGTYAAREVVVQYRESDLDFIARLLEQEGMFFFFEHTADGHTLVIADGDAAFAAADPAELGFCEPSGLRPEAEHVFRLIDQARIERGAATLDDYDFKRPGTQLRATRTADRFTALELRDCPGEYADRSEGERYAQIRLEAEQARRRMVRMETTAHRLAAGTKFALSGHPSEICNREYVVTAVRHTLEQPQGAEERAAGGARLVRTTRATVMPADAPFRPRQRTRRPTIHGCQTALVVGPSGEEIWTDEYGRVKVQFHWDQEGAHDENSSCWIRVAQAWAGGTYGVFFLPRVGQEVVVSFLEGNPDRPLITGSVHNNDNMPPFKLPDEKTRSTIKSRSTVGGGACNEIRFDDARDAEQLFLNAAKDLHQRVANDRVESIARDAHLTVEQHQYELVKQKKHAEVRLDLIEKVGGGKHLEVGGDVGEELKGNHHEHVGGRYLLKAEDRLVLESATGICLKVGGNFITIDASGIYIMGSVLHLNGSGSALSGSEVAVLSPAAPLEADSTEPGTDVTYSADALSANPITEEDAETTWIEIELVDEAGQPWPDESYEVTESDGTVRKGRLDAAGQAHVAVKNAGECQISFPNLDRRAWEKA